MDAGLTSADVRRVLFATLLLILISIAWTIFVPGLVAWSGRVFYQEGVEDQLPKNARDKLRRFQVEKQAREKRLNHIDDALDKAIGSRDAPAIQSLILLRANVEKQNSAPAPIAAVPFFLNHQLLMWPAIYICLGWLIFVYPPTTGSTRAGRPLFLWPRLFDREQPGPFGRWSLPLFAAVTYVVYEWPLWIRNAKFMTDEGRTVYAYPNADIDRGSLYAQEIVVFGFCTLLAILWLQWTDYYADTAIVRRGNDGPLKTVLDPELVNDVSGMFGEWQVRSVVLALGFIFFTNFFWTLVAKFGDQRYMITAITAHLMWAISWTVLSLPLIARWRYWLTVQRRALVDLAMFDRPGDEEMKKEIILATKPFSAFGFSLAGFASLVSFVLPIVKVFL